MIRSFLAIDLPEEILREIGRVQNRLERRIRGGVRWTRPEGIHLTLKFFGDIPEPEVENISAVAARASAEVGPFALTIAGVGVFPALHRPRIIWLGMSGEVVRLIAFQQGLEQRLGEIGFPREERPFRPHLTLARIRTPRGVTGLAETLAKGESFTAGGFTASGLCLFKSDLTPTGAIYTELAEYPFAQQEGVRREDGSQIKTTA